jgi:hypothetical protein
MTEPEAKEMESAIEIIAARYLDLSTLESRRSDRLDFHTKPVWSIKAALEAAFSAGMVVGQRRRK